MEELTNLIALVLGLSAICITLLWGIYSKWMTEKRLISIAILIALSFACLLGVHVFYRSIMGWPSELPIPEHAIINSYVIDQANDKIFLWLLLVDKPPRAYAIKYDDEIEERLKEAGIEAAESNGVVQIEGSKRKRDTGERTMTPRIYVYKDPGSRNLK
tara:strand:- start:203 stop:679 length:477 start_codon:yes stop_codon:yes gene_type:complete